MRKKRSCNKKLLIFAVLMFVVAAPFGAADAMQFKSGDNLVVDFDVLVMYNAAVRAEDQDDDKLLDANSDEGNRNFEQWDMVQNKLSFLVDTDIQYNDFGIFARSRAFYDHVYMTDNANDSPMTNNALQAGEIDSTDEWPDDVEDIYGRDLELMDLFAYGSFRVADRWVNLRVGKQVIQWGEAFFITGGIGSAMAPIDLVALTSVGVELKEFYIPTESVYLMVDLNDSMVLKAYYQWKWEQNKYFEAGTFQSPTELFDEAGYNLLVAPPIYNAPRVNDVEADDNGQYGFALTHVANWLNETEFGLYFINYHQKSAIVNVGVGPVPALGGAFAPTSYNLVFLEDTKLYGATISSQIGDLSIAGEFSYRVDHPFDMVTRGNYWHAQASWMYGTTGPWKLADSYMFIGDIACAKAVGLPDSFLVGANKKLDSFAWKYYLSFTLNYIQFIRNTDGALNISFSDVPSGSNMDITPEGGSTGSIGWKMTYRTNYTAEIKYSARFNANRSYNSDRDDISLKLTYSF